jgi:hypothetical protein
MAIDEPEAVRQGMQDIVDRLERMNVQKAMPSAGEEQEIQELEEMLAAARKSLAWFMDWQRRELDEQRTTAWLEAMNASHAALLKAINSNLKKTNEVLFISQARLLELENSVIQKGQSAFIADPAVLEEGEYLYRVLALGAQGTEARGDFLMDAPRVVIEPGVSVLAHAIEEIVAEEAALGIASYDEGSD